MATQRTSRRYLIINADDLGQSHGVNRGVAEAHERGIVTSASLMVRWPAAVDAAAYAGDHPALSLGLHVDLGEWAYREQSWLALYEVVPLDDAAAVAEELARQLAAFRRLTGHDPTHIDSHQHVHREEPVRSVLVETARSLGVPLRDCTASIQYRGDFYGQSAEGWPYPTGIGVGNLLRILAALPAGITELGCHPGLDGDLDTMYRAERTEEVQTLCHPRVRSAMGRMDLELCSFADVGGRVRLA